MAAEGVGLRRLPSIASSVRFEPVRIELDQDGVVPLEMGGGMHVPELVEYVRLPVAMPIIDQREAWGSGADFALGAMAMGAGARRAVEVACELDVHCGKGIDVVTREGLDA